MPRQQWRNLLVRVVIFHAAREMVDRLCELADRVKEVENALSGLEVWAAEIATRDGDDAAAVADGVAAWSEVLGEAMRRQALPQEARQLFDEVLVRLRSGVPCDDPFVGMLQSVEQHARAVYGAAWRPTALSVLYRPAHPRGPDRADPYPVTATTGVLPSRAGAAIELHIYCEKFGPAAYAALPMVLTHECVCHVPARQDRSKNDSAFAEGLLDWAAYHFLNRWAVKLAPDAVTALRKHAERLRAVLMGGNATPEAIARRVGHDAADNLQAWFERELTLPFEESQGRVARLAVELNVVDRPLEDKDNLVSRLSWGPLPPDLDAALRSWVDEKLPAEKLLDTAVAGST